MPTLLEDFETVVRGPTPTSADRKAQEELLHDYEQALARVRSFIITHAPWLPPQPEGFKPWIEFVPGDPGPRIGETVAALTRNERARKSYSYRAGSVFSWTWTNSGTEPVVAYCVKLPEEKEGTTNGTI